MKILAAFLLFTLGWCAIASARAQTIEPCKSKFMGDYYRGVDEIIDKAVGRQSQLSITTIPSFSAESGLRLVGNDIYFVQLKTSVWANSFVMDGPGRGHNDFSSPQAATLVYRAALSPEIASRVKQLYRNAITNAKKSDRMGLDGVTYRMAVPAGGCGETWSPEPQSPDGRLVELIQLLSAHARLSQPRAMQRNEEAIVRLLTTMGQR